MHDIFEGVCHYDLCHAITYFTVKMQYFDLETLNFRKQSFDYGPLEVGNASGNIAIKHLRNKKLKMSAREMMCFVIYFPLMVGDLVPSDDTVWQFLKNFIEIIDILLCFEINDATISILEFKIRTHNNDYTVLFNDTLNPKFHNLTHYPRIIRKSGPLRKTWCFKYEAKHKPFKIYSHCITSRKNICLTLAKKYQLKFAYQTNKLIQPEKQVYVKENHLIVSSYSTIIGEMLKMDSRSVSTYSVLSHKGIEYRSGYYLVTHENDYSFYLKLDILLLSYNTMLFFCQTLQRVQFKGHYLAFEVNPTDLGPFKLVPLSDIIGPPVTLIETARGNTMVRLKEYYKVL